MQKIFTVDSFANTPFSGNPAAVCITEGPKSEEWMRKVAREMNLSETAFAYPRDDSFHLRWFTPTHEVKLCGHATLAAAHILWSEYGDPRTLLSFQTLSGTLTAEHSQGTILLNFPIEPVNEVKAPDGLLDALGVDALFVGATPVRYFVEVASADQVRRLQPNFTKLTEIGPGRLVVTARSDDPHLDFISRYFAPGIGIMEDPVTGATHCALTPYWAAKLGKTAMKGYQASARGGELSVRLVGDRVLIGGRAVTVLWGQISS